MEGGGSLSRSFLIHLRRFTFCLSEDSPTEPGRATEDKASNQVLLGQIRAVHEKWLAKRDLIGLLRLLPCSRLISI